MPVPFGPVALFAARKNSYKVGSAIRVRYRFSRLEVFSRSCIHLSWTSAWTHRHFESEFADGQFHPALITVGAATFLGPFQTLDLLARQCRCDMLRPARTASNGPFRQKRLLLFRPALPARQTAVAPCFRRRAELGSVRVAFHLTADR